MSGITSAIAPPPPPTPPAPPPVGAESAIDLSSGDWTLSADPNNLINSVGKNQVVVNAVSADAGAASYAWFTGPVITAGKKYVFRQKITQSQSRIELFIGVLTAAGECCQGILDDTSTVSHHTLLAGNVATVSNNAASIYMHVDVLIEGDGDVAAYIDAYVLDVNYERTSDKHGLNGESAASNFIVGVRHLGTNVGTLDFWLTMEEDEIGPDESL